MRQLAQRVARVRICCGDWARILTETPTTHNGLTGVFLDPPYAVATRKNVYGEHDTKTLAHHVAQWAIEHGQNPKLRIALCGYNAEHTMPPDWTCHAWKARGGYSSQNKQGNPNPTKERIWFSPHCLNPATTPQIFT